MLRKIFSVDGAIRFLPTGMVVLGLAALVVAFSALPTADYPAWHGLVLAIGQSILVSGVVGVLLDTFKYMGIFKDALHDVMFGENYLSNRSDLNELWLRVTSSISKNKFPSLSHHLQRSVLSKYIPAGKDFYYSRYYRECTIKWHDEAAGVVEVYEYVEIDVEPAAGAESIEYSYSNTSNSKVNVVPGFFALSSLMINGVEHKDYLAEEAYTDEYGGEGTRHSYKVCVDGTSTHRVKRSIRKRTCIKVEPFLEYSSQNFILKTEVKFKSESPGLTPIFISVGTEDFDDEKMVDAPWDVHRSFSRLMFPDQGYILVMQQGA